MTLRLRERRHAHPRTVPRPREVDRCRKLGSFQQGELTKGLSLCQLPLSATAKGPGPHKRDGPRGLSCVAGSTRRCSRSDSHARHTRAVSRLRAPRRRVATARRTVPRLRASNGPASIARYPLLIASLEDRSHVVDGQRRRIVTEESVVGGNGILRDGRKLALGNAPIAHLELVHATLALEAR